MGLGRDVNLSPPGLVEDKPGQVSPKRRSFSTQRDVLRDGDLVLQRIRHLVFSPSLFAEFFRVVFQWAVIPCLQGGVHVAPFPLFSLTVWISRWHLF